MPEAQKYLFIVVLRYCQFASLVNACAEEGENFGGILGKSKEALSFLAVQTQPTIRCTHKVEVIEKNLLLFAVQCVEVQSKKNQTLCLSKRFHFKKFFRKPSSFTLLFGPRGQNPLLGGKGKSGGVSLRRALPPALSLSPSAAPRRRPRSVPQASVSARLPHTRHGRRTEVVIPSHFFPVTASDIKQKVEEEKRICLCSKLRRRLATSSSVISGKLQTHEGGGLLCSGFRRSSSRVSASLGRSDPKKW